MQEAAEDHWLQPHAEPGAESKPATFGPAGTVVFHGVRTMQRSTEVWGVDAAQCDEQRWLKGSKRYRKPTHPAAFMGLSISRYLCIGAKFALLEAKIILAEAVRRVDAELVLGQTDFIMKRLTLVSRDGIAVLRRASAV